MVGRLGTVAGTPLLLCGHTHVQRPGQLATGGLVMEPGSVGWPAYDDDILFPHVMEAGTPHARYAIADDEGGAWRAEFRTVVHDWDRSATMAEANGRAGVAHALRTERAPRADGP